MINEGMPVDGPMQIAERFIQKIRHESQRLFGDDPRRMRLVSITENLLIESERLHQRGTESIPAIVIVGRVGEGKSWLARCFLTDHHDNDSIRSELVSGQNDSDRSQQLVWFGSARRLKVGAGEVFLSTSRERMIDLGRDYVVGDSPGMSDHEQRLQELASVAAQSAPVKLVVVSRDQIRDSSLTDFVHSNDGALIVPVIKFRPPDPESAVPSEVAQKEVNEMIQSWRNEARHSTIFNPIYMPQEAIFGSEKTIELMRSRLRDSLTPVLGDARKLREAIEREMEQKLSNAKKLVHAELEDVRLRVGNSVELLDQATEKLCVTLREELIGDPTVLRAAIRRRLRADLIERTPLPFFPYRSLLGGLTLTAGAWDRLIFSITGSVPSIAMTFFQSAKNVFEMHKSSRRIKQGVSDRIRQIVQEELRGEVNTFRNALRAVLDESTGTAKSETDTSQVTVHGIESIESESYRIIRQAIKRFRISVPFVWLFAAAGSGIFLYLMAGPIYSIYHDYIAAHTHVLFGENGSWKEFPSPPWSMMISSFALSIIPSAVIALIAVTLCCLRSRVNRITEQVTDDLDQRIREQAASGSFRIELSDPKLDSARYLLSIGTKQ